MNPITGLHFIQAQHSSALYVPARLVYLLLLWPYLTSSESLFFNPYLSRCHRGKQNAVAVETTSREAVYETSSVQTEAYIWPFPV